MFSSISSQPWEIKSCCYVHTHTVLIFNCEIHCPGLGAEDEAFHLGGGEGEADKYGHILNLFIFRVIAMCHPLTILLRGKSTP